MMLRLAYAAALFASGALAAPVGDALDRPAVMAREPSHAVLLSAAQAGPRIVAIGERGMVLASEDSGRQWRQSQVPVSVGLTALRFADATHGYAVGHGGTVLATRDGGRSWTKQLDGRQIAKLELQAAQHSGDAAALKSAERLVADGPDKPLLDLLVFDAQRVLAVGAYGLALASEDGGNTWHSWRARLGNPKELHLYALRQRGDTIAIAGEQGLLLLSTDSGKSFRRVTTPYKGSFFTLELPADGEIVLAGLRGTVLRSTDAGASWSPVASPIPAAITSSAQRGDGSVLLASQAGVLLRLKDGLLQPLPGAPLPPVNNLLALPEGGLLALTIHGAKRVEPPAGGDRLPAPAGDRQPAAAADRPAVHAK